MGQGRGRPRGPASTPYTTRTGPTTAAVLAAIDGLDETQARTIRQLVHTIYGGFTIGRQRSVSRVVRNLQGLGLVRTGYRMTDPKLEPDTDPHSTPHRTPDGDGSVGQKPSPALFVWSAELELSQGADEQTEKRPVGEQAKDRAGDAPVEDGAGWSIASDQQDLESWTFRRHRADPDPRWCTTTEAGRILGVTGLHARKLATSYGVFSPWIAVGGRVLLRRSDVLVAAQLAGRVGTTGRWDAVKAAMQTKP